MKIITVTLDPSLERTLVTHFLGIGYQNVTTEATQLDVAGQGINISRALHRLGVETHAIVLLGDDVSGRAYQALLAEEDFDMTVVKMSGQTRSTVTILDTGNKNETKIIEESAEVREEDLESVAVLLRHSINPGDMVVFGGGLPNGASLDTYSWLTEIAKEAEAHVTIATRYDHLKEALPGKPNLVAVKQFELEALFNHPVRALGDLLYFAGKIQEMGAQRVLVSQVQDGYAALKGQNTDWYLKFPAAEAGTSSGVHDALLSGYLTAYLTMQQKKTDDILKLAGAAAAFANSQVGNRFGVLEEVQDYMREVEIMTVKEAMEAQTQAQRAQSSVIEGEL